MSGSTRTYLLAVTITVAMTGVTTSFAFAQPAAPNQILGVWESENGNLKLEMISASGGYAGRVIYGNRLVEADGKTFKKDVRNPDPNLRDRSLQGVLLVRNLKWDAQDRRWEDGAFYDASSGRSYSARATLVNGKMELRAYLNSPLVGRTVVLRRVAS
jgi:uncharacterized protein (DUF2147 family)